ncbi:MAG: hypothetical protein WBX15_07415 [Thermoanaerobaculia bacterium]
MQCPFLRESRGRYCDASKYRKLILDAGSDVTSERCSSPEWVLCSAARSQPGASRMQCPFLRERNVEYCAAAAVPKYVPASNALMSRCKSDGHLYCELYLSFADPEGRRQPDRGAPLPDDGGRVPVPASPSDSRDPKCAPHPGSLGPPLVDGMPVPTNLAYAPNHMWLCIAEDGQCHVGIDALLARVVDSVEKIDYLLTRTTGRPVAILTVRGVDLQLVFPNPLASVSANLHLRTVPERLTADPYGAGWLFEGEQPQTPSPHSFSGEGLIPGALAPEWIRDESERLSHYAHDLVATRDESGATLLADGGRIVGPLAPVLDREQLVALFTEFFSSPTGWRRTW